MVAGASSGRIPLPLWMRWVIQLFGDRSAPTADLGSVRRSGGLCQASQSETVTVEMVTGSTGLVALPEPVMPFAAMPWMTSSPLAMVPKTV